MIFVLLQKKVFLIIKIVEIIKINLLAKKSFKNNSYNSSFNNEDISFTYSDDTDIQEDFKILKDNQTIIFII